MVDALKHMHLDTFRPVRYIAEHSGSLAVAIVAMLVMCYTISAFGTQRIPSRLHELEAKVLALEDRIHSEIRNEVTEQYKLFLDGAWAVQERFAEASYAHPEQASYLKVQSRGREQPEPAGAKYDKPKKAYVKEHEDERKEYNKYENRGRKEYKKYEQKPDNRDHDDQPHVAAKHQRRFDSDEVDNRAQHRKGKPRVDRVQKDYRH